MPVHLTPGQARRLGIDLGSGSVPAGDDGARRNPARRAPYHTMCHDCGEAFMSQAAETRHLDATGHANYQLVLDV